MMSLPLRTVDLLSCSHFYDWTTWYCTMMYLVDPIINREAAMHRAYGYLYHEIDPLYQVVLLSGIMGTFSF